MDAPTWSILVDECYQLGDRTLYLRLPNFHGNDVRQLQERLNVLGFSCGEPDGVYGVHTEAAVKLFQESIGALADGMAFPDTFDAIVMKDILSRNHAFFLRAEFHDRRLVESDLIFPNKVIFLKIPQRTQFNIHFRCPPICSFRALPVAPSSKFMPLRMAFAPMRFLMLRTACCRRFSLSSSACSAAFCFSRAS